MIPQWPGYAPWSKQIPTRDFRTPPQPITRSKLAKNVAKTVQRFITVSVRSHALPAVILNTEYARIWKSIRWKTTRMFDGALDQVIYNYKISP